MSVGGEGSAFDQGAVHFTYHVGCDARHTIDMAQLPCGCLRPLSEGEVLRGWLMNTERIMNSWYGTYVLVPGQFSVPQPHQRRKAAAAQEGPLTGPLLDSFSGGDVEQQMMIPDIWNGTIGKGVELPDEVKARQFVQYVYQLIQKGEVHSKVSDAKANTPSSSCLGGAHNTTEDGVESSSGALPCAPGWPLPESSPSADCPVEMDWVQLDAMKAVIKPKIAPLHCNGLEAEAKNLFGTIIHNPEVHEVCYAVFDRVVLMPPNSRFLMSDLNQIRPLVQDNTTSL